MSVNPTKSMHICEMVYIAQVQFAAEYTDCRKCLKVE